MKLETIRHNDNFCKIVRTWGEGNDRYFDLKTIEKTEKGIIEEYLSVHISELRADGNEL